MQTRDLKVLDLEVPHDRSSDRQPTYRQGADGAGSNGHGPDCGRPNASRCQLHPCTLLPVAASMEGRGDRRWVFMTGSSSAGQSRNPILTARTCR
jgi:hypothetical protein